MAEIKQLQQNKQIFFPQTVAEAVLVKTENGITTLNKILNRKIITVQGEQAYNSNGIVNFGDDFTIDNNNNITLNWVNL